MKRVIELLGGRVGLAAACLASTFALVVVPAQPAAAGELCTSSPEAPLMIDHKIFVLNGTSRTQCEMRITVLTGRATIEKPIYDGGPGWKVAATALAEAADADYVVTEVYYNCAGQGPEAVFRTGGSYGVSGIYPGTTGMSSSWWYSQQRLHYCGGSGLQDILP